MTEGFDVSEKAAGILPEVIAGICCRNLRKESLQQGSWRTDKGSLLQTFMEG